MSIGVAEIVLIVIVLLFVAKPSKVKDYAKKYYEMKDALNQAKEEINKETSELKETLKE